MTSPDDLPIDGHPDDAAPDGVGDADAPVEEHVEEPFDEEAAWRLIVENYGERVQLGGPTTEPAAPVAPASGVFDRSYLDAMSRRSDPVDQPVDPTTDEPEGQLADPAAERRDRRGSDGLDETEHFVPPEPPPVPRGTPARRLAWGGLFVPPLLMLLAVVLSWTFPGWAAFGLVAAFVGGFVFLVLTMPRDHGDGRDDGAVV
jgi:hypothetical protein